MSSILRARILHRVGDIFTPVADVPVPTTVNYNTDIRQFADAFDTEIEFGENLPRNIRSSDFVEYYFQVGNLTHQIGVSFFEDFSLDTSFTNSKLMANGRDLLGQLIKLPFENQLHFAGKTLTEFAQLALQGTYIQAYANFRQRSIIVEQGAFKGQMLFASDLNTKRATILEEKAELAVNLIYLNRLGQVVIRGREDAWPTIFKANKQPLGTLKYKKGFSNVENISIRQNYSEVLTKVVSFYAGSEQLDTNSIPSDAIINSTDARVQHLNQPEFRAFSPDEIAEFAGQVGVSNRRNQVAKSLLRKSLQNLGAPTVTVSEPYLVVNGKIIFFEVGQKWNIYHEKAPFQNSRGANVKTITCDLVAISYQSAPDNLTVQLQFIPEDTLL